MGYKIERTVVNNFGSFPIVFSHGSGATMWGEAFWEENEKESATEKKFIDFIAGIGVNCLGHGDEELLKAISDQAKKEIHISNYYFSPAGLDYQKALLMATGFEGLYFGNSGAEANEAAIKLARKTGQLRGGKDKKIILTLEDSFHGRTLATLTATGQSKFHPDDFSPYPEGFRTVPADERAFDALDDNVAAILIEVVQGEGGVNVLDKEWVREFIRRTKKVNALVMVDEVQTGMGRCGTLLASSQLDIKPDVVTLAKGIAGGLPMGACLFRGDAAGVFKAGDHQSTFAGSPLVCAAANCVLKRLNNKKFLSDVIDKGDYIRKTIKSWGIPIVKGVKGLGLMVGSIIDERVKPLDIEIECLKRGLCVTTAGRDVIRFLPPLVITKDEIDEGLKIYKEVLLDLSK